MNELLFDTFTAEADQLISHCLTKSRPAEDKSRRILFCGVKHLQVMQRPGRQGCQQSTRIIDHPGVTFQGGV